MSPTEARAPLASKETPASTAAAVRKGRSKFDFVIMSIFEVVQSSQAMACRQPIDARSADLLWAPIPLISSPLRSRPSKPVQSGSASVFVSPGMREENVARHGKPGPSYFYLVVAEVAIAKILDACGQITRLVSLLMGRDPRTFAIFLIPYIMDKCR